MLLDLDPRDLNPADLAEVSRNWIFSFATDESLRWLTPGMVRVALDQDPPEPDLFFDVIGQRTSDLFTAEQWLAISALVDYCRENGWIARSAPGFLPPPPHQSVGR